MLAVRGRSGDGPADGTLDPGAAYARLRVPPDDARSEPTSRHEILRRHRHLQPRRRSARTRSPACARLAPGRRLGSHRRRQQLDRTTRARSSKRAARHFPVPLRYVFEREQGRSAALNCGHPVARRARSSSRPTTTCASSRTGWIAIAAGLDAKQCDYVGGRVLPIWEAEPPAWLPRPRRPAVGGDRAARLRARADQFGARVPLGVNMALRREAFDRGGGCSIRRSAARPARCSARKSASGAFARAPPASVGFYIPTWRSPRHSGARLNKKYFRRWFYWRGISRALLYAQYRARHGKAGGPGARLPYRPAYVRRAALSVSQGARASRRGRRGPCCAVMRSRRSSTNSGCGSLRASSGSGGPTAMPALRSCGPATFLSPLDHERAFALRRHDVDHAPDRSRDRAYPPCHDVLVEARTPVYLGVLGPIADQLSARRRRQRLVHERVSGTDSTARPAGADFSVIGARHGVTLPCTSTRIHGRPSGSDAAQHRVNFFHGVAGKYDLDRPSGLPMGFEVYDRVAFINRDRMDTLSRGGDRHRRQAALVGYPKLDRLATGGL